MNDALIVSTARTPIRRAFRGALNDIKLTTPSMRRAVLGKLHAQMRCGGAMTGKDKRNPRQRMNDYKLLVSSAPAYTIRVRSAANVQALPKWPAPSIPQRPSQPRHRSDRRRRPQPAMTIVAPRSNAASKATPPDFIPLSHVHAFADRLLVKYPRIGVPTQPG